MNVPKANNKYNSYLAREDMGLLDFVMLKLSGISRSKAKAILSHGGVLVDHQVQTHFDFQVHPDMVVEISRHPDSANVPQIEHRRTHIVERPYDIVYEDDDVIVVDKADEVLSVGVGRDSLNMKDLLDRYFVDTRQHCTAHLVHRLDARTSGLMVYAKSIEAQQAMIKDWHATVIDRRYVAVVENPMYKDYGHIESYLHDTPSLKIVSSRTNDGGQWASTDWRLLRQNDRFALLELHLHTGRKNQIRVHMQVLHHPIVGDYKYGSRIDEAERMCLHAFRLAFHQPRTGQVLEFETPFPAYFLSFFEEGVLTVAL